MLRQTIGRQEALIASMRLRSWSDGVAGEAKIGWRGLSRTLRMASRGYEECLVDQMMSSNIVDREGVATHKQ